MSRARGLMRTAPKKSENAKAGEEQGRGQWSRTRDAMASGRLSALSEGILSGLVALELSPEQIIDEVDSDRIASDWRTDDSFLFLLNDIKRRGLQQPIRVRPVGLDWKPNPTHPTLAEGEFAIQSGRRRLEAIRQINDRSKGEEGFEPLKVPAFISTDISDAELADLEERWLENSVRSDLSGFEQLISIGILAEKFESKSEMKQAEIADRLSVSQPDVSLGRAVLEYRAIIEEHVDISKQPKRFYRSLLPRLKRGYRFEEPVKPEPITAVREQGRVALSNGIQVTLKRGGKLEISLEDGSKPGDEQIEWILDMIAKGAAKVG